MNPNKAVWIALLVIVFALTQTNPAWGAPPKVQVFEKVEKGFFLGLDAGLSYPIQSPISKPGVGFLTGLELGYDFNWVFRAKAGFLTEHFSGQGKTLSNVDLPTDVQSRLAWGQLSLALLATERFYAYVQAGAGYRMASPKTLNNVTLSDPDGVAVLGGGGLEYYPNLRHLSFAIEAQGLYLVGAKTITVALFPVVRYTFGVHQEEFMKPAKDQDSDGVPDEEDKCPAQWGLEVRDGCPEPDTDGDGIMDREDDCVDIPGPVSNNGCPVGLDTDGDSVLDKLDACPKVPGKPENEGCPDTDADGVADHIDKCPEEPGLPEYDGCANEAAIKVAIRKKSIELREQVHFDTGSANIQAASFALLDQVVATLRQHPEIRKLRVEGHTDDRGPAEFNKKLSARRAQAVVDYLIAKGIAGRRLVAEGFGEERPIASNNSEQGRSVNRRVDLIIVEQD